MGLTVTRHVGETILLQITPGTSAEELYSALVDGIVIRLVASQNTKASLDIAAPSLLQISRPEQHDATAQTSTS